MKTWTPQDVTTLRRLYPTHTSRQLALHFGTTDKAIRQKCFRLGLKKGYGHARIQLSKSDTLWLRLNFPHMSNEICALRLGISPRTVIRRARALGLSKTPQFMHECQIHAAKKAEQSHRLHGTYPDKGYYSPNLQKGQPYQFTPSKPTPKQ